MKLILPLRNISLNKYPKGNCYQFYGENPQLYWRFGFPGGHNGIDLVTKENDPIYSVCNGYVYKVDYGETSFGKGVWVLSEPYQGDDGKLRSLLIVYFHLNQIYVQNGQKIATGDVIGLEGNTGFVISGNTPFWGNAPAGKGVHIHYGIYPLIRGTNPDGSAYKVETYSFIKEIEDNGRNGAADPFDYFDEGITIKAEMEKQIGLLTKLVELFKKLILLLKQQK